MKNLIPAQRRRPNANLKKGAHTMLTVKPAPFKKLADNQSGVAATEFALVLPFMAMIYFGAIETSFLVQADRRVTNASSTMADLITRVDQVTFSEAENVFLATAKIVRPNDVNGLHMRLTSVVEVDGKPVVDWSQGRNMDALSAGDTVTLPPGILPAGASVVVAEVSYDFDSSLGYFIPGTKELSDRFFLRPRQVETIDFIGTETGTTSTTWAPSSGGNGGAAAAKEDWDDGDVNTNPNHAGGWYGDGSADFDDESSVDEVDPETGEDPDDGYDDSGSGDGSDDAPTMPTLPSAPDLIGEGGYDIADALLEGLANGSLTEAGLIAMIEAQKAFGLISEEDAEETIQYIKDLVQYLEDKAAYDAYMDQQGDDDGDADGDGADDDDDDGSDVDPDPEPYVADPADSLAKAGQLYRDKLPGLKNDNNLKTAIQNALKSAVTNMSFYDDLSSSDQNLIMSAIGKFADGFKRNSADGSGEGRIQSGFDKLAEANQWLDFRMTISEGQDSKPLVSVEIVELSPGSGGFSYEVADDKSVNDKGYLSGSYLMENLENVQTNGNLQNGIKNAIRSALANHPDYLALSSSDRSAALAAADKIAVGFKKNANGQSGGDWAISQGIRALNNLGLELDIDLTISNGPTGKPVVMANLSDSDSGSATVEYAVESDTTSHDTGLRTASYLKDTIPGIKTNGTLQTKVINAVKDAFKAIPGYNSLPSADKTNLMTVASKIGQGVKKNANTDLGGDVKIGEAFAMLNDMDMPFDISLNISKASNNNPIVEATVTEKISGDSSLTYVY